MHYIDFNIQFSLAGKPHLIDVRRYTVFKCPTPLTFLRFPRFVSEVRTSILGNAAPLTRNAQHGFPATKPGRLWICPVEARLTFCHFVAAAVVIRNDWETHLCYFWEASRQGVLLHAMTYMLPGPAGLSDHLRTVRGAFLFLLPRILGPSCCLWLMHSLPPLWSGHSWGLACLSSNLTPVRVKESETPVGDVVLLNIEAEKNFSYLGCLLFTI